MKPDSYTKIVLTVIAVALLYLCVVNTIQPTVVQAQSPNSVPIMTPQTYRIHEAVPVVVVQGKAATTLGDTVYFKPKDY